MGKRQSAPIRGVNVGGWLVLEPYITPSIFNQFGTSVVDEYTLTKQIPNAGDILQTHWKNFVGLADFQKIADNGFNAVRIPIGYWAFQKYEGDPYIQGAADFLDEGIAWARQTGLKVWIDLHGERYRLQRSSERRLTVYTRRTTLTEWTGQLRSTYLIPCLGIG